MTTETNRRTIEVEMTIDAPPEAVWKALTDPGELTRWFPLSAAVEPGAGGVITLGWGPEMTGGNRILAWEPGAHLRTTWFEPHPDGDQRADTVFKKDAAAAAKLVVDYYLEGQGGGTVLRMVHSGFSKDAKWDGEFAGHRRGWTYELGSLRNYLDHHRGKDRHVAWVRRPIGDLPVADAMARVIGTQGLSREGGVDGLGVGDNYSFTTVHGDRLQGRVTNNEPGVEFAGTIENLDRSLLRCGIESCFTGSPEAVFWVSTWGTPERAAELQTRWKQTLGEMFA